MSVFTFDLLNLLDETALRLAEPSLTESADADLLDARIERAERRLAGALEHGGTIEYWQAKLDELKAERVTPLVEFVSYDPGTERQWKSGTYVKQHNGKWARKSDGKGDDAAPDKKKSPAKSPGKAAPKASKPSGAAPKGNAPPASKDGAEAPPKPLVGKEKAKAKKGTDSFRSLTRDLKSAFADAVMDKIGNLAAHGLSKVLPQDVADELGHRTVQMLRKGIGAAIGATGKALTTPIGGKKKEEPKPAEKSKAKSTKATAPKRGSVKKKIAKAVDSLRKVFGVKPPEKASKKKGAKKRTSSHAEKRKADQEIAAQMKGR
jgi:hypothetical protein